jgi:hypothetical protein
MVKVTEILVVVIAFGFHAQVLGQQPSQAWRPKVALATCRFEPDGRPILVKGKVNGRDCKFILDTGCTYSVLHVPEAKFLADGMRSIEDIEMEGVKCNWVKSVVIGDISHVQRICRTQVDGLIGMDVLSKFIVHIDFDNGVVVFVDRNSTETPPGKEIELGSRISGCPSVPILFGAKKPEYIVDIRKPEYFTVDTGTHVTINATAELFRSLKTDSDASPLTTVDRVTDVFGHEHEYEQISYKNTLLGPHQVKNLVVCKGRMSVVGRSYLCRYRVTFDFPRNKSYWQPSSRFACRDNQDDCGLNTSAGPDGGWFVSSVSEKSPADAAGIKAGDEIVALNAVPTSESADILWIRMLTFPRLNPLYLTIKRGRETIELTLAP